MIIVRSSLSKAKHKYFTFLSSEEYTYLRNTLRRELEVGRSLNLKVHSPSISNILGHKPSFSAFIARFIAAEA